MTGAEARMLREVHAAGVLWPHELRQGEGDVVHALTRRRVLINLDGWWMLTARGYAALLDHERAAAAAALITEAGRRWLDLMWGQLPETLWPGLTT